MNHTGRYVSVAVLVFLEVAFWKRGGKKTTTNNVVVFFPLERGKKTTTYKVVFFSPTADQKYHLERGQFSE